MIEPINTTRPQSMATRRQAAAEGGTLTAQAATATQAPAAQAPAAQTARTTQAAAAAQPARTTQTAVAAQPARTSAGDSTSALSAMRTAQEVMQAVGTAAPSADNSRIANEAYPMESRAQRDLQRGRAAPSGGTREWMA